MLASSPSSTRQPGSNTIAHDATLKNSLRSGFRILSENGSGRFQQITSSIFAACEGSRAISASLSAILDDDDVPNFCQNCSRVVAPPPLPRLVSQGKRDGENTEKAPEVLLVNHGEIVTEMF